MNKLVKSLLPLALLIPSLFSCSGPSGESSGESSSESSGAAWTNPVFLEILWTKLETDEKTGESAYVVQERYYDDESLPEESNPLIEPIDYLTYRGHVIDEHDLRIIESFANLYFPCGEDDSIEPSAPYFSLSVDSDFLKPGYEVPNPHPKAGGWTLYMHAEPAGA